MAERLIELNTVVALSYEMGLLGYVQLGQDTGVYAPVDGESPRVELCPPVEGSRRCMRLSFNLDSASEAEEVERLTSGLLGVDGLVALVSLVD